MGNDIKGTLLFVDDEKGIINAFKRLFAPLSYRILTALGAKEALDILEVETIDIVISDMRMAEVNGAQFLIEVAHKWPETKRILLTGYSDINLIMDAINEGKIDHFLLKPWNNDQMIKLVKDLLEARYLRIKNLELQSMLVGKNKELSELNISLQDKVEERTADLRLAYQNLESTYDYTVDAMITIVELFDPFKESCRMIARHARLLASKYNLPAEEIRNIYLAAILHSIGKIGFSPQLRNKPFANLNAKDLEYYQKYPATGAAILDKIPSMKNVAEYILYHREHYDGSGFPKQLKGQDIPLGARILSILVDYYNLRDGLIYPSKLTPSIAYNHMHDHVEHYDPGIFEAFTASLGDFKFEQDNEEMEGIKVKPVMANQLKPGMVLATDLISKHGFLLIPKNQQCTQELIDKIKSIDNLTAYIRAP